jgi:hypothetical protein
MHYQFPTIVLDVPEKSLSPRASTVDPSDKRRLQLLAYLAPSSRIVPIARPAVFTSKDDSTRTGTLTKQADFNDELADTDDMPDAGNDGGLDDDYGMGDMDDGGDDGADGATSKVQERLKQVRRKKKRAKMDLVETVVAKVTREVDAHDEFDDVDGPDGVEYANNEGGMGHMYAGGKKDSRSRDKIPIADAGTGTKKTGTTSKVQERLKQVRRKKKRAKMDLVQTVIAQVLAAQNAKEKTRKAKFPKGQGQLKRQHAQGAHAGRAKQGFTTSGKRRASDGDNSDGENSSDYDTEIDTEKPPPRAPKRVRITAEYRPNNRLRNWTVAMRRSFKPNTIAEAMRPWELTRERFDVVTSFVLVLPPNIVCITPRASLTQRRTKHLRSTASAL